LTPTCLIKVVRPITAWYGVALGAHHHLLMGEATEFATPISDDEERLDTFHEDSPVRYRRMDQVIGDELNPGQAV
jgi:hypothetical protein